MSVEELHAIQLHGQALGQHLYDRTAELLNQGVDRHAVERSLIEYYQWLGQQGREDDQDAVADVLDCVVGFCAPGARL